MSYTQLHKAYYTYTPDLLPKNNVTFTMLYASTIFTDFIKTLQYIKGFPILITCKPVNSLRIKRIDKIIKCDSLRQMCRILPITTIDYFDAFQCNIYSVMLWLEENPEIISGNVLYPEIIWTPIIYDVVYYRRIKFMSNNFEKAEQMDKTPKDLLYALKYNEEELALWLEQHQECLPYNSRDVLNQAADSNCYTFLQSMNSIIPSRSELADCAVYAAVHNHTDILKIVIKMGRLDWGNLYYLRNYTRELLFEKSLLQLIDKTIDDLIYE